MWNEIQSFVLLKGCISFVQKASYLTSLVNCSFIIVTYRECDVMLGGQKAWSRFMEDTCDNDIFKMQIKEISSALWGIECVQVCLAEGSWVGNDMFKDGKLPSHLEHHITYLCRREIENALNKGKQNSYVPT